MNSRKNENTLENTPEAFIARWHGVTASELSTSQSFIIDLCELLDVPRPHPTPAQDYMFERPVTFTYADGTSSAGRVDCYLRGKFVAESKKLKAAVGSERFSRTLLEAHAQAQNYARALPPAEGRPPFLLVLDIGTVIEVYAEFSRSGGTYIPFPDSRNHRIALADLVKPEVRERLRLIWTDPDQLDPARVNALVTRTVSDHLAKLAKSLEQDKHAAEHVAAYLTRALFSMFAEDVELLPKGAFFGLLQTHREAPGTLQHMLRELWADMDHGGFSGAVAKNVLKFNGKLFKGADTPDYSLLLTTAQIDLLIEAAKADWRKVEPAIFGTLLERALNPIERHALGAHYTPRAYVERLVLPTVLEPLRAEWANVQAVVLLLVTEAEAVDSKKESEAKRSEARNEVHRFHHRLCTLRVLDPACGSGNFLYVTLEHLKRLEGEVFDQLDELGDTQSKLMLEGETVTLQQLRGIEVNPRAAAMAELVLWIGYLQWQIRTFDIVGVAEPVVHNYGNIECRDAVLAWDKRTPALDTNGQPLTRWDGVTQKAHPVTGELVPDESAQLPQWHYSGAKQAEWPTADFIVGNPPFIGASPMRSALGDGYVEALRKAWPDVPDSADFVMFWWARAAALVGAGKAQRMGFITTNSLRQTLNRRVVQVALDHSDTLAFAIPDHPWVDSADGAAVRIAMTVLKPGAGEGRLQRVLSETQGQDGEVTVTLDELRGVIHADLSVGANVASVAALQANLNLSNRGVQLNGPGFIVTPEEAITLLAATPIAISQSACTAIVRNYRHGRDLTDKPRGVRVIDAFGLSSDELRNQHPAIYQRLLDRVKPERDAKGTSKDGAVYAKFWWLHGKPRQEMRKQLVGLPRYIATPETATHRIFQFLDASILPDNALIAIAVDDAYVLGVLSSQLHETWALATGGTLEDRPRYNKSRCFETFPFPDTDTGLTPGLTERIRTLAEQIDTHRKKQQVAHADVTLTGIYNVLEKLRSGEVLTAKDKTLHEHGLVGVLKSLHDELDTAVLAAYGWTDPRLVITSDALLARLVALNTQRSAEEAGGHVRWLRPTFQAPGQVGQTGITMPTHVAPVPSAKGKNSKAPAQPWPTSMADQVKAVADVLAQAGTAMDLQTISSNFSGRGRWRERLPAILETLVALGRIHPTNAMLWVNVS
nr:DNA methyltransferase [uncultured Albidiferax sp.]